MPGPRPFGKPSGSRGGGSRREPFGGRRGRGNRPRGPGKPHCPPRGLDNFDADNFDRMQERVYDDLEKKTEKKMNKLTKLCDFMGEEDQENCMGWA